MNVFKRLNKIGSVRVSAIGALVILLVSLVGSYFYFVFDVGIVSNRFASRDFERAMTARKTGDCHYFVSYIIKEQSDWYNRCTNEKDRGNNQLTAFEIVEITVRGNEAFLAVDLTREPTSAQRLKAQEEDYNIKELKTYRVNYDMERLKGDKLFGILPATQWKIRDEAR